MLVEMKIYTTKPGKADAFMKIYEDEGLPIQEPVQGNLIGMYKTEFGPVNQVILLWGYENIDDRFARRKKLSTAPGWAEFMSVAGPMVQDEENRLLVPSERGQ